MNVQGGNKKEGKKIHFHLYFIFFLVFLLEFISKRNLLFKPAENF